MKDNPQEYAAWKLEQQLNFGLSENEKIDKVQLKKYLPILNIDEDVRNLMEFCFMTKSLLTTQQKNFLDFFNGQPDLYENFYFSGATALSEYYTRHRVSEDLDFFSENEINVYDLNLFLTSRKKSFGAEKIQFVQSFNRNIFLRDLTAIKN
jgi:hypothetical protein